MRKRNGALLGGALVLAVLASLVLFSSCGVKKRLDAAKDALNSVKDLGQELATEAASGDSGQKSPDREEAEALLAKAESLPSLSFTESVTVEGKSFTSQVVMKGDKLLRRTSRDGSETIALVEGSSITFVDMGNKQGMKQETDSPADARGLISILSGNLFLQPEAILRDNDDIKKAGTETVNGIPCEVFEAKFGILTAAVVYKVWVSRDYGITIKAIIAGKESGKKLEEGYRFEVSNLKTSGITDADFKLPAGIEITDMATIGQQLEGMEGFASDE